MYILYIFSLFRRCLFICPDRMVLLDSKAEIASQLFAGVACCLLWFTNRARFLLQITANYCFNADVRELKISHAN